MPSSSASFSDKVHTSTAAAGGGAAAPAAALLLSRTEHEDLCTAFRLFDTDNKGTISIGELVTVLKELDGEQESGSASSLNMRRLLSSLQDMPPDRRLSLDAFVRLMTTPNPTDARDEWEKVFDLFSRGKDHINSEDLRNVASDLGESLEDEDVQAMIYRVAPTGQVKLEQFREIMNRKLFS